MIDVEAQAKLSEMLEDVLKGKWLLQCVIEPAARNASSIIRIYLELANLRTCEIVKSALGLSFTTKGSSAEAKEMPSVYESRVDTLGKF